MQYRCQQAAAIDRQKLFLTPVASFFSLLESAGREFLQWE